MINIETILSSFDDRGTLLKWLKAVEKALQEATLTSVDIITISTQQIQLKFNFEDGTSITTPLITLPKGDKGDKGDTGATGQDGVSVTNVTVDASNHIIVTLSNSTQIDAGAVNIAVDNALSDTSENPVQNKVIYIALAGKQDLIDATHKLSADNVDDSATTNKFVTSSEKSTWNGKQNALTTTSVPDGTIDDAIGFDSQGNVVKGSAGGGGGASRGFKVTFELNPGASGIKTIPDYFDTAGVYHQGLTNVSEGNTITIENVAYLLLRGNEYYMTHVELYRKRFLIGDLTSTTGNFPITIEESISTDNYANNSAILIPLCDVKIGIGSTPF